MRSASQRTQCPCRRLHSPRSLQQLRKRPMSQSKHQTQANASQQTQGSPAYAWCLYPFAIFPGRKSFFLALVRTSHHWPGDDSCASGSTSISDTDDLFAGALIQMSVGGGEWAQCPRLTRKAKIVDRHQRILVKAFRGRVDDVDRAENRGKVDVIVHDNRRGGGNVSEAVAQAALVAFDNKAGARIVA